MNLKESGSRKISPLVISDEIDSWSPIKNFKTIQELRNSGTNTTSRIEYLINSFSKGPVEDKSKFENMNEKSPRQNYKFNDGRRGQRSKSMYKKSFRRN